MLPIMRFDLSFLINMYTHTYETVLLALLHGSHYLQTRCIPISSLPNRSSLPSSARDHLFVPRFISYRRNLKISLSVGEASGRERRWFKMALYKNTLSGLQLQLREVLHWLAIGAHIHCKILSLVSKMQLGRALRCLWLYAKAVICNLISFLAQSANR